MSIFEKYQNEITQLKELDKQRIQLLQAVEEFLNNFGKENVLYPTRAFLQVDAAEIQKLAQIFYSQTAS